jgi:hypothetical protein
MSRGLDTVKQAGDVFIVIKVSVTSKIEKGEADSFNERLNEILESLRSLTGGRASARVIAANAEKVSVRFDRGGKRAAGGPGPG